MRAKRSNTIKSRQPARKRSRASHDRLVQAAERLIANTGTSSFTLADVCFESGLSVSRVSRRVENKRALTRAVQERLYARLDEKFAEIEAQMGDDDAAGFERHVRALVGSLADLLKRDASSIKAMIEASWNDPVVARCGFEVYRAHCERFKTLLLRQRQWITHADPEHAAEFCFSCVFEMVASHFGFGRRVSSARCDWSQLMEDLHKLCIAYLTGPARGRSRRAARRLH
jgi:AcrR family transcriptional regulator